MMAPSLHCPRDTNLQVYLYTQQNERVNMKYKVWRTFESQNNLTRHKMIGTHVRPGFHICVYIWIVDRPHPQVPSLFYQL